MAKTPSWLVLIFKGENAADTYAEQSRTDEEQEASRNNQEPVKSKSRASAVDTPS